MKAVRLVVGIVSVLSLGNVYAASTDTGNVQFSGTVANNCQITEPQNGTVAVGTSNENLLSSKPSEAAGTAGSFKAKCTGSGTLSISAPTADAGNPGLTSPVYTAGIYSDSAGATSAIATAGGGASSAIAFNGSRNTYYAHMSATSGNPILNGTYGYTVTVTVTAQ